VFENRALRKVFGPNRKAVTRGWRKLRNGELIIYKPTPHPVTTGMKSRRIGRGMRHVWGRRDMHTRYLSEDLNIRNHLKDPGADGGIIVKWINVAQEDRGNWATIITR